MIPGRGSEAITPTAHYTGHVWSRNGLSHPELATLQGRLMFEACRPTLAVAQLFTPGGLEDYLLARHEKLDELLTHAIEEHGVTQVIEVACGLSPRGWRFMERYGDRLAYVEADLPDMAALKRDALLRMGSLSERHRVVELDALRDEGPASLAAVASGLTTDEPLAIVTEGLLGYFEFDQVMDMWRRFARVLGRFRRGVYLADTYFGENLRNPAVQVFRTLLSAFVRGRVYVHFEDAADARAKLGSAGFAEAEIHPAEPNAEIIAARVR